MYFMHSSHTLFTKRRLVKSEQNIVSIFKEKYKYFPVFSMFPMFVAHALSMTHYSLWKTQVSQFPLIPTCERAFKEAPLTCLPSFLVSAAEARHARHQPADQPRRQRVSPSSNRIALFPLLPPFPIALTALCIKPSLNCSVRRRPVNQKDLFQPLWCARAPPGSRGPHGSDPPTTCLVRLPRYDFLYVSAGFVTSHPVSSTTVVLIWWCACP